MDPKGRLSDADEVMNSVLGESATIQHRGELGGTASCLWMLFVSPEQAFVRLRSEPRWFMSLTIAGTAAAASQSWFIYRMGPQQFLSAAVTSSQAIDKAGVVRNLASNASALITGQAFASALGCFIAALSIACIVWLCATIVGETLRFKPLFSTVSLVVFAYSVTRACMLLATAQFAAHPELLSVKDPLATSVAYFAKPHSYEWAAFLGSLELLSIGALVLLIHGIRIVLDISWRRASLAVLLPWLAYITRGFLIALF